MNAIESELTDRVLTLWLCRDEARNALDGRMLAELTQACAAAERDASVRVLILAGRGKAFCAGADLGWLSHSPDAGTAIAEALRAFSGLRKPTVAAVHGTARGGALGLLAAADVVVAADATTFAFSEVRLGLAPACIAPLLLRRASAGALRRWMLSGECFDAQTARSLGLVDLLTSEAELRPRALGLAASLAQAAPGAQAAIKDLLQRLPSLGLEAGLDYGVEVLARLRSGAEGQKGLRSFLEKKACAWD